VTDRAARWAQLATDYGHLTRPGTLLAAPEPAVGMFPEEGWEYERFGDGGLICKPPWATFIPVVRPVVARHEPLVSFWVVLWLIGWTLAGFVEAVFVSLGGHG
jgi:hypothetical protein